MMNKKYLMRGFAALALVAGFSSCVKDVDGVSQKEIDDRSKENAEMQLGISIPDGQTWDMASQVEANVTVDLKSGENYTVTIYSNDPLADGKGTVLAKGTIENSQTYITDFTTGNATHEVVVGVTDKDDFTVYKHALIENGKINVNFGGSAADSRSLRTVTVKGDVYSEFNFPTQKELNDVFKTTVPADAEELVTNGDYNYFFSRGAGHNYKITSSGTYTIGGGWQNSGWEVDHAVYNYYNVYINVGANNEVTLKRNSGFYNIYILSGKVTIDFDSNNAELSGIISVASGATVTDLRNHIAANGGVKVYNRGTYIASNTEKNYWANSIWTSFDIGNNASFYNEGIFEAKGAMSYSAGAGNTSYFINFGDGNEETVDFKAPSMTLNSTCHFYSGGNVEIAGETKVTQSGIVWINNGHYTTNTLVFSSGNGTFYNYCQLKVTDLCRFLDGEFNMMADSYAEFGKGIFDNFYVKMYNNSTINVKNGSKWWRNGAGKKQGFYAVGDAVAYANLAGDTYIPSHNGSAIHVMGPHMTLTYENLKFYNDIDGESWRNLYTCGYEDLVYSNETNNDALIGNNDGRRCWDVTDTGHYASSNSITIQTPSDLQCAAVIIERGEPLPEDLQVYTYAFEDQTVGSDYDLNDVVLKVNYHVTKTYENGKVDYDKTKLDATLVAAGATYNIKIKIGDTYLFEGQEIHDALGVNAGVMVNTGNGKAETKNPVSDLGIAIPTGWNGVFTTLPVTIEVTSTGKNYSYPNTNAYPHAVMIPVDWRWPTERTIITKAYPGTADAETVTIKGVDYPVNSFDAWAATPAADRTPAMEGWYNNPNTGLTMTNSSPATNN